MRKIGAFISYQKLHFDGRIHMWSEHTPLMDGRSLSKNQWDFLISVVDHAPWLRIINQVIDTCDAWSWSSRPGDALFFAHAQISEMVGKYFVCCVRSINVQCHGDTRNYIPTFIERLTYTDDTTKALYNNTGT